MTGEKTQEKPAPAQDGSGQRSKPKESGKEDDEKTRLQDGLSSAILTEKPDVKVQRKKMKPENSV